MSGIESAFGGESRQLVERLAAKAYKAEAGSFLASAGGAGWIVAAKIKRLSSYNNYIVKAVELGEPGTLPVELGEEFEAVNLAESFLQTGQLQAGTFVPVCGAGSRQIFYAKP